MQRPKKTKNQSWLICISLTIFYTLSLRWGRKETTISLPEIWVEEISSKNKIYERLKGYKGPWNSTRVLYKELKTRNKVIGNLVKNLER
jgi:hypothetical protein